MSDKVKVWQEQVVIPTYEIGEAEASPMFLENRVYQGSSGVVYPYQVVEKIADEAVDKSYNAVWIENEYIKVMILPELGGRVQMAYDKIKERHFIYYNQVVKPALVGLTGPWISGGIEFNWPQHHRPSTFLPIDFTIEEREDGSAAIIVNERERMFHQRAEASFVLRPGRAVLEIEGRVSNPTAVPQTFLWWANPAVFVDDYYQSVFPCDVNAVFDHGKRDVSKYPIATGVYYKMDYSEGVDISRYKNIPVPTSYMAIRSSYNFVGGYEHNNRAGVLHVANHNVSPGKKQWTWGNSDFGQAWDRNLTDEDGPYIELMTGVYTDNQPDFSWLQPLEEKSFTQYFLPYRELGVVKNASDDLLMNIEMSDEQGIADLKIFATSCQSSVKMLVRKGDDILFEDVADISPEQVYEDKVEISSLEDIVVEIYYGSGELALDWKSPAEEIKEVPEAAKPAKKPQEINSVEQLYLTGLHLEQYRHATYDPTDYYIRGLEIEPTDIRCNNAMGLWSIRKGQFVDAESYLKIAVETQTERNLNPYDGEPLYNLGLALKYQGRVAEAYTNFYKACWNSAWQDVGYFALAQISLGGGNLRDALSEIDKSLLRNWHSMRSRHLKATILRKLGRTVEALKFIEDSLEIDKFNFGALYERYLITGEESDLKVFLELMRCESRNFEELMLDYADAYMWSDAISLASIAVKYSQEVAPMIYYYQSWCYAQLGNTQKAIDSALEGENRYVNTFFPNHTYSIIALECVSALECETPMALYLLGNVWYDRRQYQEALMAWEGSLLVKETPLVLRNLALIYFNKCSEIEMAVESLERAFELNDKDARILMELDQLYKRLNAPHSERLAFLDKNKDIVMLRDDLYLEYATLLNQLGRFEEAKEMVDSRKFHPWEGGEGKVTAQYQISRVELVKKLIREAKFEEALTLIEECYIYPHNLGEGKLQGAQENDFNYFRGVILRKLGRESEAVESFKLATTGSSQPAAAIFYNDQKPDKIFYQGLALLELGDQKEAKSRFNKLISYGEKHIYDTFEMDYFAVSLPDLQIWDDDMDKKNLIHCNYLLALGYLGFGDVESAKSYFAKAAELDVNHPGVQFIGGAL